MLRASLGVANPLTNMFLPRGALCLGSKLASRMNECTVYKQNRGYAQLYQVVQMLKGHLFYPL